MREVELLLQYYSGKRAGDRQTYFKWSVCEADRPLLDSLRREAASWTDLQLLCLSQGYADDGEILSFMLSDAKGSTTEKLMTVAGILRSVMVKRIVWHWLLLVGGEPGMEVQRLMASLDASVAALLDLLRSQLSPSSSPRSHTGPREVPPI